MARPFQIIGRCRRRQATRLTGFDTIHASRAQKTVCHAVVKEASFFEQKNIGWRAGCKIRMPRPWSLKIKMGRQPRSGDFSLAIGPLDPETDRR